MAALWAVVSQSGSAAASASLDRGTDWAVHNGQLADLDGGGFTLRVTGPQPVLDRSVAPVRGPAVLEFDMRTNFGAPNQTVRWRLEGSESWIGYSRIPVHAGGVWRSYRVPLGDSGVVTGLRFGFTADGGYAELRKVRVVSAAPGAPPLRTDAVNADHAPLRLRFDPATRAFKLHDATTSRTWRSTPLTDWVSVIAARSTEAGGIVVDLRSRFSGAEATLTATLAEAAVRFDLDSSDPDAPMAGLETLPPRFDTDFSEGKLVFCDRSCGVLLEQSDTHYAHWPLKVYGNTHCMNMPWVGAFDGQRGDGLMLLVETPADAEVSLEPDAAGRHWPQVRWLDALDRFAYRRTATLHLTGTGGYVALAKRYRGLLEAEGKLKRLEDKARDRPGVALLKGAPILWGKGKRAIVEQARARGMARGLVNNCLDPVQVAWLQERGYLTGRYDNFTDVFDGKTGPRSDDVERTAVRQRPGATPMDGWLHDNGKRMSSRSSAHWIEAAEAYAVEQLEKAGHDARFIDVAAAVDLVEDWNPARPFDRRQDMAQRRNLFRFMKDRGLVVGTEHGNDWAADLVDFHEGSLSGPFWWSSWEAGRLVKPTRAQLTPEYLKYGIGFEHRVPLWQLVYGDCLVSTWYWGDTAGTLYQAAPELADRKDLIALLYGGVPLLWMDEVCFGWDSNRARWLRSYHDTCKWHEVVGFSELLTHEFLTGDRAVQRSEFAGGATVLVNFDESPREAPGTDGIVLAPRGCLATAPGFRQERLWVDGQTRTAIEARGYLTVQRQPLERFGVEGNGRLTAFATSGGAWNIDAEPGHAYRIDARRLLAAGIDASIDLHALSQDVSVGDVVAKADAAGVVSFEATPGRAQFTIRARPAAADGRSTPVATQSDAPREEPAG
ncbi:MAG: glycoside hydrolase [Lacipirellulaceae bacterium]